MFASRNVERENVVRLFKNAQLAELVDASVSNTDRKLCRFDSGAGYTKPLLNIFKSGFLFFAYGFAYTFLPLC